MKLVLDFSGGLSGSPDLQDLHRLPPPPAPLLAEIQGLCDNSERLFYWTCMQSAENRSVAQHIPDSAPSQPVLTLLSIVRDCRPTLKDSLWCTAVDVNYPRGMHWGSVLDFHAPAQHPGPDARG